MATNSTIQTLRYDAIKKSTLVAYLLWFFFGVFGGHRFYPKKTGSAVAMLIITLVSLLLSIVGIGLICIATICIWVLVDAFLIPGWVTNHNLSIINTLNAETD